MKRIISALMLTLMLAVLLVTPAAADDTVTAVLPDWLITEIGADNTADRNDDVRSYLTNPLYTSNAEPYEFIELYNCSGKELNIYDYALFNCTAVPTSTSFETLVYKTEPVKPGNWIEWDWGNADAYWDAGTPMPLNPDYADGKVQPGECIILWMYGSHNFNCLPSDFRAYWRVADDVKIFMVDSNAMYDKAKTSTSGSGMTIQYGGGAKNFNIKNSGTAAYGVIKWDDAAQAKFDALTNKETGTGVYLAQEGLNYINCDLIDSWAIVFLPTEIMDFIESSCQTFNYIYSTTSMFYNDAGGKRAEYSFTSDYLSSTLGKLTDDQKKSMPDPASFTEVSTTAPVETTPAPIETTPAVTEPVTTPEVTEAATTVPAPEVTTAPAVTTAAPVTTAGSGDESGCGGSVIGTGALLLLGVAGAALLRRKKH